MVKLANLGGQTDFDITTFGGTGNVKAMDEALQFRSGFRLPGFVGILQPPRLIFAMYLEVDFCYRLHAEVQEDRFCLYLIRICGGSI